MEQVNDALEQYAEFLNDSEIYGEMPELEEVTISFSKAKSNSDNNSNIYKCHIIDGFIIDDYEETGNFGSLISDETKIFAESGNQLVTLVEKDGKLEAIGSMVLNDGEETIKFEDEAEKIKKSTEEEITDIKFAKSYILGLDMIYYQTKSDEFVVPYFDNVPESVYDTIENGTMYTADEFVGRLRQHRTINGCRLCRTSACRFSVISHKNFLTYASMPAKFLCNLAKNLTSHLHDNNYAVLP
ncbi:MAG: hypothetical protein ACI4JB_10645 [Porcipelethomonas sp.]